MIAIELLANILKQYAAVLDQEKLEGLGLIRCKMDSGRVVWGVQFRFAKTECWFYLQQFGTAWTRTSVGAYEEIELARAGAYFASAVKGLRKGAVSKYSDTSATHSFVTKACALLEEIDLQRLYLVKVKDSQGGVPFDGWAFLLRRMVGEPAQLPSLFGGTTDYRVGVISAMLDDQEGLGVLLTGWYKSTGSAYKVLLHSTGREPDTGMLAPRLRRIRCFGALRTSRPGRSLTSTAEQ